LTCRVGATTALTLEQLSLNVCRALRLEANGRGPAWMGLDTVAYRLKVPTPQLGQPIYFAKMNGWVQTAGVPPHSVVLTPQGHLASRTGRAL
jgi:hypothetical protein